LGVNAKVSLDPTPPKYLFVPVADQTLAEYPSWAPLTDVFSGGKRKGRALDFNGAALATRHDTLAIDFTRDELKQKLVEFYERGATEDYLRGKFGLCSTAHFDFQLARLVGESAAVRAINPILYRPFDERVVVYHTRLVGEARPEVMRHLLHPNLALLSTRRVTGKPYDNVFSCNKLVEYKAATHDRNTQVFPLWLYPHDNVLVDSQLPTKRAPYPNISEVVADRVAKLTGLAWDDCVDEPKQRTLAGVISPSPTQDAMFVERRERGDLKVAFGPRDLFDWTYAILHSPTYRARYAEHLKSDFACIPLPKDRASFKALVPYGTMLVALHLIDTEVAPGLLDPKSVRLAGSGDNRVVRKSADFETDAWDGGRMYISPSQWFETVPERVANFHIGGYRPARKWLKDRTASGGKRPTIGRVLTPEDILHYRRMIVAMDKTIDVMAKIDTVINEHGGWPDAFRGMTD
jgi:predicted helicase